MSAPRPGHAPVRLGRQASYLWQRFVLRRSSLLADGLPLGLRLRVPARDDVGRRLFKYRVHEPAVLEWLGGLPAPPPGALAVDVGANLGWYSVVLHRLSCGALDVHAFEPDPVNRKLLEENLALNGADAVHVSPLALADASGTARLNRYRDINRGKHSLLPLEGAVDSIAVRRGTLDGYLDDRGLSERPLWLLKIDVEGLEADVIRGAHQALTRTGALMMEYSPMYLEPEAGRAMLATLEAAGLCPFLHDGQAWAPCTVAELMALKDQRDTVWRRRQGAFSERP